jgi:ADP-dependent NAD(P)H-hydrate dehydratase / NAD(P)H-hydrate epimerase
MRVLNGTQMREADRRTIEEIGIPSRVLMENAGRETAAAIVERYPDVARRRVSVLCGRGNNGGDGFVVARVLAARGVDVAVFLVGSLEDLTGDARANLDVLHRVGIGVTEIPADWAWETHLPRIAGSGLIVDAMLGTGTTGPLHGLLEVVVSGVNASAAPVVAVDLPTGLSADTAEVPGACVRAALTVTLGAPKLPLVLPPADSWAGDLAVADIGIPAGVIDALDGPRVDLVTEQSVRTLIAPRPAGAHKGSFGHVLVVAGSRGKSGAARLAAVGALRSGAGLVTVAAPAGIQPAVAAMAPEYMTEALDETAEGTVAGWALARVLGLPATVIAAGPGLGATADTATLVRGLLEQSTCPLVLDADALNALAGETGALRGRADRPVVVTPHPGEMGRLAGLSTADVQRDRLEVACRFARSHGVYVVLKGHRSLIATPAGEASVIPVGNPGMATGGTGDVLTGVVAAWLAQGLDPGNACKLAVYLHALAGDLASAAEGETGMTAGDLAAQLGRAVLTLTGIAAAPPPSRLE